MKDLLKIYFRTLDLIQLLDTDYNMVPICCGNLFLHILLFQLYSDYLSQLAEAIDLLAFRQACYSSICLVISLLMCGKCFLRKILMCCKLGSFRNT